MSAVCWRRGGMFETAAAARSLKATRQQCSWVNEGLIGWRRAEHLLLREQRVKHLPQSKCLGSFFIPEERSQHFNSSRFRWDFPSAHTSLALKETLSPCRVLYTAPIFTTTPLQDGKGECYPFWYFSAAIIRYAFSVAVFLLKNNNNNKIEIYFLYSSIHAGLRGQQPSPFLFKAMLRTFDFLHVLFLFSYFWGSNHYLNNYLNAAGKQDINKTYTKKRSNVRLVLWAYTLK